MGYTLLKSLADSREFHGVQRQTLRQWSPPTAGSGKAGHAFSGAPCSAGAPVAAEQPWQSFPAGRQHNTAASPASWAAEQPRSCILAGHQRNTAASPAAQATAPAWLPESRAPQRPDRDRSCSASQQTSQRAAGWHPRASTLRCHQVAKSHKLTWESGATTDEHCCLV